MRTATDPRLSTSAAIGDHADVERTKTIALRLDPSEHARWTAAAEADGRTLSDWIRRVVNGHAEQLAPVAKPKRKGKR